MSELQKLQKMNTLKDMAFHLGMYPKDLSYMLYCLPPSKKYKRFKIAKKNGGEREILAPCRGMKGLQRKLLHILELCVKEVDDLHSVKSNCHLSHGFRKNHSIVTNANLHKRKRWVFNFDLKDFFPSINFGRVRGFFINNRDFKLNPCIATIIAQITTFEGFLPQGAPTSPIISNLIANHLDVNLNVIAKKYRCTYSRYADDITFSTNQRGFPRYVGITDLFGAWQVSSKILNVIHRCGFELNANKTRMNYYWSRQDVTGLTVNEKVNISKSYWHELKAQCVHLFKTGEAFSKNKDGTIKTYSPRQIISKMGFVCSIKRLGWKIVGEEQYDDRPKAEKRKWSEYELGLKNKNPNYSAAIWFQRVMDFVMLTDDKNPILITEGESDKFYILEALKAMPTHYPLLCENGDTKKRLFKFYNQTEPRKVFQLFADGSEKLRCLIEGKGKRLKYISAHLRKKPVIFLLDNDDGLKPVISALDSNLNIKIDKTQQIHKIQENIYIVLTPLIKAKTDLEDFLPKETTEGKHLGNRVFSRDIKKNVKDKDKEKQIELAAEHFGKDDLAAHVVRGSANKYDYTCFKPILDAISKVISDHG